MTWQLGKFHVKFVKHHKYVHNLFQFCNKLGEEPGGVAKKKSKPKGIFNVLFIAELYADNDEWNACALQIPGLGYNNGY